MDEQTSYGYDSANRGEPEGICGACGQRCTDDDVCECPWDCPVPDGANNPARR